MENHLETFSENVSIYRVEIYPNRIMVDLEVAAIKPIDKHSFEAESIIQIRVGNYTILVLAFVSSQ